MCQILDDPADVDCYSVVTITLDMSEELCALRDMARKFSREEILPVAAEHDKTGEVQNYFLRDLATLFNFPSICIFISVCLLLVSMGDNQESSCPWSTQYTCP